MSLQKCKLLFEASKVTNSKSVLEVFDRCLPDLIKSCIAENRNEIEIAELRSTGVFDRFERVLQYNVANGKKIRGLLVVEAYRSFVKPFPSGDDFMRAVVLGWCVEFLQASFLVADDIMDGSKLRRGQPCWYTVEGIGLSAFNDAFFLESTVYSMLDMYLADHPGYVNLIRLFHDCTRRTINGQEIDLITSNAANDCRSFKMSTYTAIVKWKTAFYTLLLPVHLGLVLSRNEIEKEVVDIIDEILLHLGVYFQVQDDYLDIYGDPEITGKVGTDIQDNKCAWPIVRAIELATPKQADELFANYGKPDNANVEAVKRIFGELGIQNEYVRFEERSLEKTKVLISSLPKHIPKRLFVGLANRLFKRVNWRIQRGLATRWNSTVMFHIYRESGAMFLKVADAPNGRLYEYHSSDRDFKNNFSSQNSLTNDDSEETLSAIFSAAADMLNQADETNEIAFKTAVIDEEGIGMFIVDSGNDLKWNLTLKRSNDLKSLVIPMAIVCATFSKREEVLLKNISLRDDKLEKYSKKHGELDHGDGWIYGATKRFSSCQLDNCKPSSMEESIELSASSISQFATVIESVYLGKKVTTAPATDPPPCAVAAQSPQDNVVSLPPQPPSPSKRPKKNAIR